MFENVAAVSAGERQQVLAALERLHSKAVLPEHRGALGGLRATLQSPLFTHILTLQHSITQLRMQLSSIPPDGFSFSRKGQLIVSREAPPTSAVSTNGVAPSTLQAPPPSSSDFLERWILTAAKGRVTQRIVLCRPVSGGLGFSVVGLNPEGSSNQGFFIKHIQDGGVAHRDGRLQEKDQILVINGSRLEAGLSQKQALVLLQKPTEAVELVVARDPPPTAAMTSPMTSSPPPPVAPGNINMDQWSHLEEIELVNDGSGLGFGIVGGKATGVVVRTLIQNSVAAKDGRLRTGDHILRIGATPTSGLSSDQVVQVLQGCGSHVTLLIARGQRSSVAPPPPPDSAPVSSLAPPPPPDSAPVSSLAPPPRRRVSTTPNLEGYEIHEVALTKKDGQSLGISIIGYNALTSHDAVGVFVKNVVPGSAAAQNGNVKVHDRLIALDGVPLHGLTNQEVLEVMKRTGPTVVLSVVRRKPRALERSLDKVERKESRLSTEVGLTTPKLETTNLKTEKGTWDAALWNKWVEALGPNYEVLVVKLDPVIEDDAELQKSSKLLPVHTLRLGVELDSFDGHHYVSSVVPGGPVDKHGVLRPEDELLEVNNVQLYGKSRREVVSFLKEVPPPFTLVCCRHPTSEPESEPEPEPEPEPPAQVTPSSMEEIEVKLSSLLCSQTEPRDAVAEQQPAVTQEVEEEEEDEEEEEEEEELALWSPDVQIVELQKEKDKGLGFSILDYQDPLDPGRCVMVVRSLVPGGPAARHGGLLPGDQVVAVGRRPLAALSLGQAVDLLKATEPGTIRISIRKPLEMEATGRAAEDGSYTHLPVPKGFGDGSILPEDLHQEEEEEEEELILDGGMPRYSSGLPLMEESQEMAVDEEEEEEKIKEEEEEMKKEKTKEEKMVEEEIKEEEEVKKEEKMEERKDSLPRKPPPSWEEWKRSLSRGVEETWRMERLDEEDLQTRSDQDQMLDSRDSEAELTLTDTEVAGRRRRGLRAAFLPEREDGEGEETPAFSHWGPPRRVEVCPEAGQSLGLSIVGGRHVIRRLRNGEELKGIFIKQVLTDSAAEKTHCLKTGDKILEVSGVDLRAASHEEAVRAIKSATSPVVFTVQSLSATPRPVSLTAPSYSKHKAKRTESPQPGAATPPLRQPPPYRPPSQSEHSSDLQQARGLL